MSANDYLNLGTLIMAILIMSSLTYWTIHLGIPPAPTSGKIKRTLKTILPKHVQGDILELGCGSGSLLSLLARHYADNQITGIERSHLPYLISKIRFLTCQNIKVLCQNIRHTHITDAGLIICYLHPDIMQQLARQLEDSCHSDCIIISHTFRLPGWHPEITIQSNDLYRTPVYLYRLKVHQESRAQRGILESSAEDQR